MTRIRLMMSNTCEICDQIKEKYAQEIAEGKIELVNLDTPEGVEIAHEAQRQGLGLEFIPSCLIAEVDGKMEVFECDDMDDVLSERVK